MEKITVNKEFLKDYESLLIELEIYDIYEIKISDIMDIYCEAESIPVFKSDNQYSTDDGFIKISASAIHDKGLYRDEGKLIKTNSGPSLKQRLETGDGCADMVAFSLKNSQNDEMRIAVPNNPLYEILYAREGKIELSNCPTLEFDSEGNMIISFGESSKLKRTDNNYAELIEGWKEKFADYEPQPLLQVKLIYFYSFSDEQTNFSCSFKICDKNCKIKSAQLEFLDCQDIRVEFSFPQKGDCKILISKLADGRIYVGFDGLGIEFICSSVIENDFYFKQLENDDDENQ